MRRADDNTTSSRALTAVSRLITPWERRHLGAVANVRFAGGGFTLGVGAVLLSLGRSAGTDQERRKCNRWAAYFLTMGAVQLSGGCLDTIVARSAPPRTFAAGH
jgi:hypothetical protein